MKKSILSSLLCIGVFSLQAQTQANLLPDGDFESSSNKWSFGKDYTTRQAVISVVSSEGRNGSKCAKTISYISGNIGRSSSWMRTKGLSIEGVSGKSYSMSFWASDNVDVSKTSINIKIKKVVMVNGDSDSEPYQDEQYKTININSFTTGNSESGWKQLSATFQVPEDWTSITEVRFNLMDQPNLKIDDIVILEVSVPTVTGLQVERTHSHEAKISWTAVDGASGYQVKVGNGEWLYTNDTHFWATGLSAGAEYTVSVKGANNSAKEANIQITTSASEVSALGEIPYVFIENDTISKQFTPFIFDADTQPVINSLSVDDTEISPENGVYSLNEGEGRTLKVKVTIGDKVWTLEYIGITVK